MGDIDEYDLLDKQLDSAPADAANGDAAATGGNGGERKERHTHHRSSREGKDRDKDRERRHRSSRSKRGDDEDPEAERRRRHRSRSRERRRSSKTGEDKDRGSSRHRRRTPSPRPALPYPPRRPVREVTPPEVREQRERERELKELDRDTRTVFAYNLNLKADEKDIFEFFSRAGTVEDVRIIMDRNTRRSKGFAYIEMGTRETVIAALALGGQQLMGQTVMVKSSEAEKNLAWEAAQVQNQTLQQVQQLVGANSEGPCKLRVRNLHVAMSETDVRDIFQAYGPIESVAIQKDSLGKSQGHGYVTFSSGADATRAIQQLNGLEIAGAAIKVEIAPDSAAAAGAIAGMEQPTLDDERDTGGGGVRLTADKRAQLMSRLAGGDTASPGGAGAGAGQPLPGPPPGFVGATQPAAAAPAAATPPQPLNPLSYVQGILGPSSPIPTHCLLLKNMFDPSEETEPDWNVEIGDDVKAECGKYGSVAHLFVDKDSKGFVYVRFESVEASSAAQKALHGRWFAGKQVCAEFQFVSPYTQRFGA